MEDFWRYAFEAVLGCMIILLGYFFSTRLAAHSLRLEKVEGKCTEVEKDMARDNLLLANLTSQISEHTSKEEVHWERVHQMNERLIRIESKMPNGRLDELAKKVDRLLEKVS